MHGHNGDNGHGRHMMWMMALCCAVPAAIFIFLAFLK